jgi:hypothetical protein
MKLFVVRFLEDENDKILFCGHLIENPEYIRKTWNDIKNGTIANGRPGYYGTYSHKHGKFVPIDINTKVSWMNNFDIIKKQADEYVAKLFK